MNSHQRRVVVRAIARDKLFRMYDSHGFLRLFVRWDLFPAQQSFGKSFDKLVMRAKEHRNG